MQRFESLVVQAGRSVGSIALNRPEALNALNVQMLMELPGAIQSLEDDPAVRCIVLTGNGSAFCSGFDLKEQMQNRPHGIQDWEPLLDRCFNAVMSCGIAGFRQYSKFTGVDHVLRPTSWIAVKPPVRSPSD